MIEICPRADPEPAHPPLNAQERAKRLDLAIAELISIPVEDRVVARTAIKFGVKRETLRYHIRKQNIPTHIPTQVNPATQLRRGLRQAVEERLYKYVHNMGMIGYALGPKDIRRIAMGMARSAHNLSFKGSKHWFRSFLKRHPTLRKRICQKFDVLRAGAMNWQEIVKYFDL